MQFNYDFEALRKHISFTYLTQMISCPRAALLGRILRVPVPYKPSKARDIGLMVHEVLEKAMLKSKERGEIISVEEYIAEFKSVREAHPDMIYQLPMTEEKLAEYLRSYQDEYFGHKLALPIEAEFELPNVKLWGIGVKGRVDLQVGQDVIDYKTKSKSSGEKKREATRRVVKLQGCFYRKALEQAGKQIETFQAHNIIITTKEVKIDPMVFDVKELKEAEPELKEMVENALDVMNSGRFLRNYYDMYCPCQYVEYCNDDAKTKEFIESLKIPTNIY